MASTDDAVASPKKRSHSEFESDHMGVVKENGTAAEDEGSSFTLVSAVIADQPAETSSDDDFGPALPSTAPKKKRRKLPYERLYISALPKSLRYSKSLMHKDQLSFVSITPLTDFLITSSVDGVVKFWKKVAIGIESVKEFRAHSGEIKAVSVSQDGRSFATAGADRTIKIFDVITFGTAASARMKSSTDFDRFTHDIAIGLRPQGHMLGAPTRCFGALASCL